MFVYGVGVEVWIGYRLQRYCDPASLVLHVLECIASSTTFTHIMPPIHPHRLRLLFNCFSSMSCWYIPTPICLGSILTSSANGSWRRRPMDTALRKLGSIPGSSASASGVTLIGYKVYVYYNIHNTMDTVRPLSKRPASNRILPIADVNSQSL